MYQVAQVNSPTPPHPTLWYSIEQFLALLFFAYVKLAYVILLRFGLATLMSIRRSIEVMSWSCNMPLKNTSTPRPFVMTLYKVKYSGIYKHTSAFSFKSTAPRKEP